MPKKLVPYLLLLPASLIIFPILIYPVINNLYLSFFQWSLLTPHFKPVGIRNYITMFSSTQFVSSVWITLVYTFWAVLAEFLVGFALATFLMREMVLRRLFRILAIVPYLSPPVIVALVWRLFLDPDFTPINELLRPLGIVSPAWIATKSTALMSVIFVNAWRDMPFVALVLLAGLQSLPSDPYDAAVVDGANGFQILTRITLPLLRPVIAIVILFQTIFTLRSFDLVWVLTGGGPGQATNVLSVLIYKTLFSFFDGGSAASMSVVMLALTVLLTLVFFRVLREDMD